MPARPLYSNMTVGLALGILLLLCTIANVMSIANALSIRDNCRRVSHGNDRTRGVLEHSLEPLKNGKSDGDYQRIFGFRIVTDAHGNEVPNWRYRLDLQIMRLEAEIAQFPPIDCTVTVLRWIKGD